MVKGDIIVDLWALVSTTYVHFYNYPASTQTFTETLNVYKIGSVPQTVYDVIINENQPS